MHFEIKSSTQANVKVSKHFLDKEVEEKVSESGIKLKSKAAASALTKDCREKNRTNCKIIFQCPVPVNPKMLEQAPTLPQSPLASYFSLPYLVPTCDADCNLIQGLLSFGHESESPG